MAEEKQSFRVTDSRQVQLVDNKIDESCESMESSSVSDSFASSSSLLSSSADLTDDASSSSNSSSGPLYELADLMAQLPVKRGLSKFYHGKSQTFGSLANVRSIEDLAKKESCYGRRMKSCKSYGGNLNQHKFGPKPTIAKRSAVRRSFSPPLGGKSAIVVD